MERGKGLRTGMGRTSVWVRGTEGAEAEDGQGGVESRKKTVDLPCLRDLRAEETRAPHQNQTALGLFS